MRDLQKYLNMVNIMHYEIIAKLISNGFECYIVGGYIRDYLLGNKSNDIDLATNATPNQITNLFENYKLDLVGKQFGVVLINNIEVATYRKDINNFCGHKKCEIDINNVKLNDDLSRRDFTINAMALDPTTNEIIDLFNGKKDIRDKTIRFVGNPNKRIFEDPNRMLRACRIASNIDGKLADSTIKAIINNQILFLKIAPERIQKEIMKAMAIKKASLFFKFLHECQLLKFIFPELELCVNHPHGLYHKEDVFEHQMIAGDFISINNKKLKLATYLHDIGKPKSYDGKHFLKHEEIGNKILLNNLKNLKFSNIDTNYISNICKLHMNIIRYDSSKKSIRKLSKKLEECSIYCGDFIEFKIADRAGNLKKENFKVGYYLDMIEKFEKCWDTNPIFDVKSLALSGGEIIKLFNLRPSKEIGLIQKHLLDYVINYGNEKNNKENLIDIARAYIKTIKSKNKDF